MSQQLAYPPRGASNTHLRAGKGWYQEWGKPAIALQMGDIIDIPEGVKHWHGAQKDAWFQHIATHINVADTTSNEWLEAVSDEIYNRL